MTDPAQMVRRYFAAFAAGDIDAALACIRPDAVWHVDGDTAVVTVGITRGHAGIRQWLLGFSQGFRPLAFSVDRLLADETDVVAIGRFRHEVPPTGAIVDSDYAIRFTVRDGLIARYQIFEDSLLIAAAQHSGSPARQAKVNGTLYGWNDAGRGNPIVFLHGLFLDRSFWDPVLALLGEDDHRRVVFDMPGHGLSGWRDGLDLDGIADDLALWLAEQATAPATLVGHSQGGMVAMRIAARYPALVARLVLVNTSARAEYPERLDAWRARQGALLGDDDMRATALIDVQRATTASAWIETHPADIAREHAMMMRHDPALLVRALHAAVLERADIRQELTAIGVPAEVLSGALDRATPAELGAEIAESIQCGRHRVIADAAHHLPVEAPAEIAAAIDIAD